MSLPAPLNDSFHGTMKGYRLGCRCEHCRGANAEYQRGYQARRKANSGMLLGRPVKKGDMV